MPQISNNKNLKKSLKKSKGLVIFGYIGLLVLILGYYYNDLELMVFGGFLMLFGHDFSIYALLQEEIYEAIENLKLPSQNPQDSQTTEDCTNATLKE